MASRLICYKCGSKYGLGERHPMVCSHCKRSDYSICKKCTIDYKETQCPCCYSFSYQTYVVEPYFASLADGLKVEFSKTLEDQKKVTSELNDEVARMNQEHYKTIDEKNRKLEEMAKKLEELEKIKEEKKVIDVKCIDCDFVDNENSFNICRTCAKVQSKIDVLKIENPSEVDVSFFAICSTCSIRKHFREGHDVVDFYPVFASINYKKQVIASNEYNASLNKTSEKIDISTKKWAELVEDGKNMVSSMTGMVKTAKSSLAQKELGEKIAAHFEKVQHAAENAMLSLDQQAKQFSDDMIIVTEEYLKYEAENCSMEKMEEELKDSKND